MNILITGGFGYLGGRIAQSLYSQGHDIILGSRKIRSSPEWLQTAKVVKIKWDSLESLKEILKDVDAVIDLAGLSNDASAEIDPDLTKAINTNGAIRIIEAAKAAGIKKWVVSKGDLKAAQMLIAELKDFPFDRKALSYKIISYDVIAYNKTNKRNIPTIKGNKFNKKVVDAIKGTPAGGVITFTNIKAKLKNVKNAEVRNLGSLVFTIK